MELEHLEVCTQAVCQIAKQAGQYIREERQKFSLESVERKHAHDYVSYVDKGSEKLIVNALRELLPEAGFITEEGLASHDAEQLLWVVDPLDGTTNFIHQYAPYAVSIALLQGKEVIIGRFTLYPTENMWTFILLDQIDGGTWQVQWSFEAKNRLVLRIF